jgi:hypothetical protein
MQNIHNIHDLKTSGIRFKKESKICKENKSMNIEINEEPKH